MAETEQLMLSDSSVTELDLSLNENKEYRRLEEEYSGGGEFEMAGWGKIIDDEELWLETESVERSLLIRIPEDNSQMNAEYRGKIDDDRFYYFIVNHEFIAGAGVYDLSKGEDFRLPYESGEANYVPVESVGDSLILFKSRKDELCGYAKLDLETYELTDFDLSLDPDMYQLSCIDISPDGSAAANISVGEKDGSFRKYAVSLYSFETEKLIKQYVFYSENDYVNFKLDFVTDNQLYVYAYQYGGNPKEMLYTINISDSEN